MRRLLVLVVLICSLAAVLVALPTMTTTPGAAPRPVAAELEQVALTGVDPAARAELASTGPTAPRREPVVLSPALTGKRFSLMGVTWLPDPALGEVEVQFRHRSAGGWSDWDSVEADSEDAPDVGTADTAGGYRLGSAPIWTGPSDGVQVRVDAISGARPRDVRLELIDPGTSPADAAPSLPRDVAGAAEPQPAIISRAEWGADESIRRGSPSYTSTVKVGFVHHTASSNAYTAEQAAAMVRGIYAYHVQSNGWSDIGYNFLVDRFGRAYEGRAGGMDRFVLGAHTGGFNVGSFGVSLLGDFSTVPPSTPTVGMLSKVLAWKLGSAYRDPRAKAVLTSAGGGTSRFASGTQVTFDVVSGHRDAGNTSCPGATTYARMGLIRDLVAQDLGAGFVDPVVDGGTQFVRSSPAQFGLRAGTLGDVAWTGTVTSTKGEVLRSTSGTGGTAEVLWDLTDGAGEPVEPGAYVVRLAGGTADDTALPITRTVLVKGLTCRGAPLARALCRARARSAGAR